MITGSSNIKEELRKFRQIKRAHGLPEVNLNRTFENSKDMIRFPMSSTNQNNQNGQKKKKSPILVANELEFTSTIDNNFFSNPILNGILSPNTVQKLELVKKMDAIEEKQNTLKNVSSQELLYTDEDKENVNTINNAIVHNQQKSIKFTFESKKFNNRYISQDQLALSRNTIFTTDKSFDFIDFRQNNNSRVLEKDRNEQTATFKNQFTLECGGNTEREGVGYDSIDGSLITPQSSSIIDLNKKARLSRSKDNSILDHDIISFYQNIKAHKEKQIKSQKKSDGKSQLNTSQIDQKVFNMSKPPKRNNNMTIKTDLLNESILNKSINRISNNNNLTASSTSLLKSANQNSTIILSTSPYNPRKSKSDRRFTRSLTPVNQCPSIGSQNTIEIKKLNLFEEDELRQQIDILLKEKEQDRQIIQSLSEDNKYLQKLSENSQQNHKSEIENHKLQIEMLHEKINQQEAHIKHLSALNSLNHSQVDKEEMEYLKNENLILREGKLQAENAHQQINQFLNEKINENIQLAEQIIYLRTELDKYIQYVNKEKKNSNNNILEQSINYTSSQMYQDQQTSVCRQPAKGQNLNMTYEEDSNNLNSSKLLADVSTCSQADTSNRPKRSYSQGFPDGQELNTINISQYNATSSHFQKSEQHLSETFKKIPLSGKSIQQKNSQRSFVEQTRRLNEQNNSTHQLNSSGVFNQTLNSNQTQRYQKRNSTMYIPGSETQIPLPQRINVLPEQIINQNF